MKFLKLGRAECLVCVAGVASGVSAHFLDDHFGPFESTNLHESHSQHVLGIDSKLPPPDFKDDLLNYYNPLFSGINTFAGLPWVDCFGFGGQFPSAAPSPFEIAVVGAPFDTGVSYRPGARFGPDGIREGSRRIRETRYLDDDGAIAGENEEDISFEIVECGDIPMSPFDNRIALDQLYRGHRAIFNASAAASSLDQKAPKLITLGGDHTITFSALRAASEVHGPISVVHFDSHIDTWDPIALGGNITKYAQLNHGTFLHFAHEKGYIGDNNMHVGIRAPMIRGRADKKHDVECGFETIYASDIDRVGIHGIARQIKEKIGTNKVYFSVDIDVLDPVFAPGTGTPEPGGFTSREFAYLLRLLKGLDIIGADIVEVAPAYDTGANTVLNAAHVVHGLINIM